MSRLLLLSATVLLLLGGCSGGAELPASQRHRTSAFEPGAPSFDMEAVATLRAGVPGLDLYASIPYTSLIFLKQGDVFASTYALMVVIQRDGARLPVMEETWTDTVRVAAYAGTQGQGVERRRERLDLEPGTYTVTMRLEDEDSGAETVRTQEVAVTAPAPDAPAFSDLRLEARRGPEGFAPAVALSVPGAYDSLRAVVELYHPPARADLTLTLVRFRSDTSAARPPHWLTPPRFSLSYLGVDYSAPDTLQRSRRSLQAAGDAVTVQFNLPVVEPGTYRVDVRTRPAPEADEELVSERYFTVRPPAFPRVEALEELVDALAYIARPRELKHIRAAETPQEMQARFDAFWGNLVPNRQEAAGLLRRYYSRVEEANRLFSGHKDGWRTDRGMVFIILGMPAEVDEHFDERYWIYYGGGGMLPRRLPPFIFKRANPYGPNTLYDNYILQRDQAYEEDWRDAVQRWREGRAL